MPELKICETLRCWGDCQECPIAEEFEKVRGKQADKLATLFDSFKADDLIVCLKPFGLPEDYISFVLYRDNNQLIAGAISEDGRAIT